LIAQVSIDGLNRWATWSRSTGWHTRV